MGLSMPAKCIFPLSCLILGILAITLQAAPVGGGQIREPAWAGAFYPADSSALAAAIDSYRAKAASTVLKLPPAHLRALIMPHAGYLYSGLTAAHAARVISPGEFSKVVLLGPDHRVGFRNGAISSAAFYRTPLGLVQLHPDVIALLRQEQLFRSVPASDRVEHSLEVVLPFLQRFMGSFKLVPVVLGPTDPAAMAAAVEPLLDTRTLLVVSSDLSHYLPYEEAVVRDRQTIGQLLDLDASGLVADNNRACGREALLTLLELANRHHWRPVLLHYANSGDATGERDRVVGYAALAFYAVEKNMTMEKSNKIGAAQGQHLVQLARQTISERLRQPVDRLQAENLAQALRASVFQEKRGVFVTLHKHGQLRGCIGSLSGYRSIVDGVRENAINAAFNDYRFGPVTAEELADLEIEVSILTEPQPLQYDGAEQLLTSLRPGMDGVIIHRGGASATFLPQVWEQLPEPADFLSHLCRKAGLSPQDWRQGGLEVQIYQVQYFAEEK